MFSFVRTFLKSGLTIVLMVKQPLREYKNKLENYI